MAKRVVVVDYGAGNLYSVRRALEVSGAAEVIVSSDFRTISEADGLILPGVGAFADGMRGLRDRGLVESIVSYAHSGRPLLGICLGMQMFATSSEEFGRHEGLGLIPGEVVAIPNQCVDGNLIKVPSIGWVNINPENGIACQNSVIGSPIDSGGVYLVHSYHVRPFASEHLLATYSLGGHSITAAIQDNNITGLQFHPERSGPVGLAIISRFVASI